MKGWKDQKRKRRSWLFLTDGVYSHKASDIRIATESACPGWWWWWWCSGYVEQNRKSSRAAQGSGLRPRGPTAATSNQKLKPTHSSQTSAVAVASARLSSTEVTWARSKGAWSQCELTVTSTDCRFFCTQTDNTWILRPSTLQKCPNEKVCTSA